ncbi:small RNA 2'-O-methyltransferase-like [Iris pallida]|uniref:Small RNA 2'-O-methyltransferase-like n=1 Tax=Iris pallida TaxID=29817 RepID=A0AAX6IKW1_IRIPA|nr:small RNA 2'-O-methyltransferase-like [Iris pallida]
MKGCLELQISICKLIITFFKRKNPPVATCLTILWSGRRVNHSLCSFPVDKDVILYVSEQLGTCANTFKFWVSCLKGDPSDLLAFLQKFLPSDSLIPELSLYKPKKCHGLEVTVDEVKKAVSSLSSKIPLSSQSVSIAGYLYYDLSERLFSNGHLFEAFPHAKMALVLRLHILQRNFLFNFKQQPAEQVDSEKVCQNRLYHVCLEAIGSAITEVWPYNIKCSNLKIPILTTWSVLRCYLESILQVGIINESIGNRYEAEFLFLSGKKISCLQGFPIFQIVFMTLLGQVYRKKQLYDLAENELQSARKILMENEMIISCKHCVLSLDASIDMQFGDLYRYSSEKGCQIQCAKTIYQSALRKLNHDELKTSLIICKKLNNNNMKGAKFGVLNIGKFPSEHGAVECNICASSSLDDDHASGLNDDRKPRTHSRARASNASLAKPRMEVSDGCSQLDCEDTLLKKAICWRCLIFKVMEGGIMQDIIYLQWECHRRRLLLRLLTKIAKCKHGAHEVHDAFWQCISLMLYQKLPSQKYINAHVSHLFKLIGEENSRDIFPIERAYLLYNTSLFVLNHCQSEHNRKSCCPLSNFHLPDVVSWLLSAFIIFREVPLLFQKVSKLLALMLISTKTHVLVPFFSESSLSIDHWTAYFHQASLGTYIPGQYVAWKESTFNSNNTKDTSSSSMLDTFIETSNFLRLAPGSLESLEEFVKDFFPCLPTVPIICISMIGNDYIRFIGEAPPLHNLFPAWMLISRLHASGQPIVMLLSVNVIPKEVQLEDSFPSSGFLDADHESKSWRCPCADYTILDRVAPSFRLLMKENFLLLHSRAANWWTRRTRLDKCLKKLLKLLSTWKRIRHACSAMWC